MNPFLGALLLMSALTPNTDDLTRGWVNNDPGVDIFVAADTHLGPPGVQNRDEAPIGSGATDPDERLVAAMTSIIGVAHPLGGTVRTPSAKLVVGDLVHEGSESTARYEAMFPDSYENDGNHDQNHVRDMIIRRRGSLTWGVKLGPAWFQALTETYTSPSVNAPPDVAQITGPVAASLATRPPNEPTFLVVHRALDGGYLGEWDSAALDALEALALSRNTIGIIHGHNHYSNHGTWRGFKTISPGSVTQSPMVPPYTGATYSESFTVLRVRGDHYDIANYIFGYDANRIWAPGTWEWSERVAYQS